MPNPFRLGFLSHLRGREDAEQAYRENLEIFDAADQLGFDAVWVAQHHFKDLGGMLPSPFPFLAAVGQRTKRLRLGTSIIVLPFEHPLRVAEDAAVVDIISNGRLELGVGSGSDADEFEAFGVDIDSRHQRTTDALITLKKALAGETLGEDNQRLRPPAPTLGDRLWLSALSIRGAQYAAQNDAGLLLSRFVGSEEQAAGQEQEPVAIAFREAWGERPLPPRIGLSRGIYLGSDRQDALRQIEKHAMGGIPPQSYPRSLLPAHPHRLRRTRRRSRTPVRRPRPPLHHRPHPPVRPHPPTPRKNPRNARTGRQKSSASPRLAPH